MNSKKQLTYKGLFRPWPIRSLNAIARSLQPISDKSISLEVGNLRAKACRKTGLVDWGHPSARQALEASLDSVQREGRLTYFGRFALRQLLIPKLCNPLRIVEALRRFPQIGRQEIRRPVFITGWYRCGTTYLHNLLAAHPQSRTPRYWELMHPCPAAETRTALGSEMALSPLASGCAAGSISGRHRHSHTPGSVRGHSIGVQPGGFSPGAFLRTHR